MTSKDRAMWRLCLALAALCSIYAVLAAGASADSLKDDIALFQQKTGICPGGIAVTWIRGLEIAGRDAAGGARAGVCEIVADVDVRTWGHCETRRFVFHEGGHILGLPDGEGIMSTRMEDRELVFVPGCPGYRQTSVERVQDRVLTIVPVGWSVSCGRVGRMIRCTAESPAKRPVVRRYETRVGKKITLKRVKTK
jgi:hypothetical protein